MAGRAIFGVPSRQTAPTSAPTSQPSSGGFIPYQGDQSAALQSNIDRIIREATNKKQAANVATLGSNIGGLFGPLGGVLGGALGGMIGGGPSVHDVKWQINRLQDMVNAGIDISNPNADKLWAVMRGEPLTQYANGMQTTGRIFGSSAARRSPTAGSRPVTYDEALAQYNNFRPSAAPSNAFAGLAPSAGAFGVGAPAAGPASGAQTRLSGFGLSSNPFAALAASLRSRGG